MGAAVSSSRSNAYYYIYCLIFMCKKHDIIHNMMDDICTAAWHHGAALLEIIAAQPVNKIPYILWNPAVHYRDHESQQVDLILSAGSSSHPHNLFLRSILITSFNISYTIQCSLHVRSPSQNFTGTWQFFHVY